MDKEWVRQNLPEAPSFDICRWALKNTDGELGSNYMAFKPEKVTIYPERQLIERPEDREPIRTVRAAWCKCSICENEFCTEMHGPDPVFFVDDCGCAWALDPGEDAPEEDTYEFGYSTTAPDGTLFTCPVCGYDVTMIKAARLRGGRRKQIMVLSVETVGEYAAVIYWMVQRTIFEYGSGVGFYPKCAYVLTERGGLVRYSYTRSSGRGFAVNAGEWKLQAGTADALDQCYSDWGSINNRKKGGYIYPYVMADLTGTTGEKAGIDKFVETKCEHLVSYLKLWRKYRGLENLVNSGWSKLVAEIATLSFEGGSSDSELMKYIHLRDKAPYAMLGMSKAECKAIRKAGKQWGWETQKLFSVCRQAGIACAGVFLQYLDAYCDAGIRALCELQRRYGDADPERIAKYLEKQHLHPREVRILLDTRNMAKALNPDRKLTNEELWPRHLADMHDHLSRMQNAQTDPEQAAAYQDGFDRVRERFGSLEWKDGEFCVILPRCNGELIREGAILRHCVGGYGEDHIGGAHTIFFVRHSRRPERCYYTLDINMNGTPFRNQLHGYGNERHGINKQYIHRIPKKVLEFVARWEREVLMPWYYAQLKSKQNGNDRRRSA